MLSQICCHATLLKVAAAVLPKVSRYSQSSARLPHGIISRIDVPARAERSSKAVWSSFGKSASPHPLAKLSLLDTSQSHSDAYFCFLAPYRASVAPSPPAKEIAQTSQQVSGRTRACQRLWRHSLVNISWQPCQKRGSTCHDFLPRIIFVIQTTAICPSLGVRGRAQAFSFTKPIIGVPEPLKQTSAASRIAVRIVHQQRPDCSPVVATGHA